MGVEESLQLEEPLKSEVIRLRPNWSSTGGASKGISLLYRLMSERLYSDAMTVVNLFLLDNPEHGVSLELRDEIMMELGKNRPK